MAQIVYAKHGIAEDGKGQYKMEVLFGSEVCEPDNFWSYVRRLNDNNFSTSDTI